MKNYTSIKLFVDDNNLTVKQFEFTVDGNQIKSLHGNLSCVYYESVVIFYNEENKNIPENYSTLTDTFHSEDSFYIVVDGKHKIEITPTSTLRLFLSPTFENQFTKSDAPDQSSKNMFDEDNYLVLGKQVDFCLQKNKTYYGFVRKEELDYGPPNENGDRASHTYYFFQISDKPFVNDKPQIPETPTFSGWIYS
ncbi:MAG: hypothetical protein ABID61_06620 [Candidatus Micrarchaeota archaeon]